MPSQILITVYVYGEIVDEKNKPVENINYTFDTHKLQISAARKRRINLAYKICYFLYQWCTSERKFQ